MWQAVSVSNIRSRNCYFVDQPASHIDAGVLLVAIPKLVFTFAPNACIFVVSRLGQCCVVKLRIVYRLDHVRVKIQQQITFPAAHRILILIFLTPIPIFGLIQAVGGLLNFTLQHTNVCEKTEKGNVDHDVTHNSAVMMKLVA